MRWPLSIPLYRCEAIREMLYDALEKSLAPLVETRFRLHLRFCPACREYLKLYRQAADMGAYRKDHPPPTELMDRTLAFLESRGITAPKEDDPASGAGGL